MAYDRFRVFGSSHRKRNSSIGAELCLQLHPEPVVWCGWYVWYDPPASELLSSNGSRRGSKRHETAA